MTYQVRTKFFVLDKNYFVQDKFDFVLEKKYFVWADGQAKDKNLAWHKDWVMQIHISVEIFG